MLVDLVAGLPLPPALAWGIVLALSLALLVKASDVFIDGAETIGHSIGLPHFIVGVTIVAIGTSLPELASSILAVLHGSTEIVAGNVVGSNIANLLVILGIAAIIDGHVRIKHRIALVDLPFLLGSTCLLALVLWDGRVSRVEAAILLAALGVYMHYVMTFPQVPAPSGEEPSARPALLLPLVMVLLSAGLIFVGAEGTVTSVIELGDVAGIGPEVIAASAVAFGTSLPEVSVTISAARRGNSEMAVGNVLGSNVFNALAVTGIAAMISPLAVPTSLIVYAVPVMLIATLIVYFVIMQQEMTRWEGWLLVLFYVLFIAQLFELA